ncbi:terminase small subunit [Amycolatopsis palatopharyngis]|uniref:terminase small subunit n=1 Tax=Amycolatopsis palatopharyngis TaxID=187982 RepID=UPI000E27C76E|nr:hypothetical protein [Amycolatopsis palatopharyngis]
MADIRGAFEKSVAANSELVEDLDAALVESGRTIAERVDAAMKSGEGQEVTKALYLVPHLMNVLREMYATPKSRHEAGLGKEGARGKLAEVRDLRKRPAPSKKHGETA